MKQIKLIPIWDAGKTENAEILNSYVINDNLNNSATFYYALLTASKAQLAQGNLTMSGEAYEAYQTNQYAYDWVASQLNLTIVGDWVDPVFEGAIEGAIEGAVIEQPVEEVVTEEETPIEPEV